MNAGAQATPKGKATLDGRQRENLEGLAARMRRIVVGEFPELYLRVNEVRAQFEIAGKGLRKGSIVEGEQRLEHALKRLNSAKFCLEVALAEVAQVLELPSLAPESGPDSRASASPG